MSFSFSQPIGSSFLAPNELLDLENLRQAPQIAADVHQNRMLQGQQAQQDITGHELEMGARLAGSLLDPTLYPTTEARAAAYPDVLARARAAAPGYFKNAPATYPGDAATQALARLGTPSEKLFQLGQAGTAASDFATRWGPSSSAAAAPANASAAPAAPSGTPPAYTGPALADIHPDLTQVFTSGGAGVTVAKSAAPQFKGLLDDLEAAGYKLDPNTTGGYNPRNIAGTNTPSQHAHGNAIDVNWQANARGANTPSNIPPELARKLAAKWGLTWGGDWQGNSRDPMHFEVSQGGGSDHPAQAQAGGAATGWSANNPMNLTTDTGGVVTPGGARLATYGSMADGVAATAAKLQSYQTDRGLDTVRKMYTEWHKGSPVDEADMTKIAGALGVGVDQPFQMDPAKAAAWIKQAQPGETGTGGKRLSDQDIALGVAKLGGPGATPGGVAARTGGVNVAGPGGASSGSVAPVAALPRDEAVTQARATGQAVPVAGTQGLWALPNGNLTGTPPSAQPAAPAPASVAPAAALGQPTIPPPPRIVANDLTAEQLAEIPALRRAVQLGQMTAPKADEVLLGYQTANRAAQRQYTLDVQDQQQKAAAAQHQTLEEQRQREADVRSVETQRLAQEADKRAQAESQRQAESAARDAQRLAIEQKKAEQGSTQEDRDFYNLRTEDPSSQKYADSYVNQKWKIAPNGNVIEQDMSRYPAPNRSIQRPSFLPAPTPQGLDEVRKADTDAKVITSALDHYNDVFAGTGSAGSWGAYFDDPQSTKGQQLLGAFDRLKTVLRSPVYYNTGVLQPAEMEMLKSDLVSPKTLRGLYATPQALATRLGEIKLAILTRQDAELRSIGKDGVIVRDAADFAKVPIGGQYYTKDGDLKINTGKK